MHYLKLDGSFVVFQNAQGSETRAGVVRLARHQVVFEVYAAQEVLRKSELLSQFTVMLRDRPIYSGSAVLTEVVNTGLMLVCEARLGESWRDLEFAGSTSNGKLGAQFGEFVAQWQKFYRISQEYKIVIADIHSFLVELHSWLQQVEFGVRSHPSGDRLAADEDVVRKLEGPAIEYLTNLFQRFEGVSERLSPELRPVHDAFARRHLHPLILAAPFAFRTFNKPLGYAGDYEMVNMMTRPPYEGGSLFAKLFNCWLLQQAPAEAHRNRIAFLAQRLREETARVHALGKRVRVLSLGCGPAVEVQRLLAGWPPSDHCEFVLIDFNQETLDHARTVLTELARKHLRSTPMSFVKKSVQQILKEANKSTIRPAQQFDLVYCAGLFDYLSEQLCQRVTSILYEWLAPGGLLIYTNIAPPNPFRQCMETFLDWHLTYRGVAEMLRLCPDGTAAECSIKSDFTGVNVFVELRKTENADRSSTGSNRP